MVSLRFSWRDVGWQRSGREGWPSCMIKSRRGGRERPKGGRESDFPPSLAHTRDEVKSSSSSVVSCHAVSIHSHVVRVCPPKSGHKLAVSLRN